MHRSNRNIQLPLCVCLCVAFCQIRVYCVEGQFFGECMNSDPGSSLRSARNASVKIYEVVCEASGKLFQAIKRI